MTADEHAQATPADDGRRYIISVPASLAGLDDLREGLSAGATLHHLELHGTEELNQRLAEAHELGLPVAWKEMVADESTDADEDGLDP